jgi:alkane 1-monooxygenase
MAANTSPGVLVALIVAADLVAIAVLVPFDYVAHYGLARRQRPGGGYEPMSDLHSWNAEGRVTNLLLLNLGHHSDHHWKPSQPYRRLGPISDTPLLPGDYAGAILTALVPPLWHRCVNKLAEHWVRCTQASAAPEPAERSARSPI